MDLRNRSLTVNDVLHYLEEEELEDATIYIEPPDVCTFTDEDSADEDGQNCLINNLNGRQLSAPAEVIIKQTEKESDILDEEDASNEPPRKKPKGAKAKKVYKWSKKDIKSNTKGFPAPDYSKYRNLSPVELFEKFIDDDIIDFFVEESTKYALFINCPDPQITRDEIRCFIAILIVSGYNPLPSERNYWDSEDDMRNIMVANAMRRDRFLKIKRFIHCADNNFLNKNDKFSKLRPFIDKLQQNFIKSFEPEGNLSYDESMVPYYGRHGCKQFLRGKPIRFGYKVWSLNTPSGYLVNFQVYQGKDPKDNEDYQVEFGKAAAPLVQMIDSFPDEKKNLPYSFYFDNLFTGLNLLYHLKTLGYDGTGTMRENRIPKNCGLISKTAMKKKERGAYDYRSTKEGVILTHWLDNNVVTVASTQYGIAPLDNVGRFSRSVKKSTQVPRPYMLKMYDKFMGGTDRMDENISYYRISVRGKKWWWPLFIWLLDSAIQNAWTLYRKSVSAIPQIAFRRALATTYLVRFGTRPKSTGKFRTTFSSTDCRVPDEIRYDRLDHLVIQSASKRRCAGTACNSIVRTQCEKCNVGLCLKCFKKFHLRH